MKTNPTKPNRSSEFKVQSSRFNVLLTLLLFLASAGAGLCQPVITNQPYTQATALGTTATFTVGARGTEPLAYQWREDAGSGFSDLADRTNATLVLTNVQSWDAGDYRVVITNGGGAVTSAVARLYVMKPALATTNQVLDNFDDNKLTGWSLYEGQGTATLTETNQQLTMRGSWPVPSYYPPDTYALAYQTRTWRVDDGKTLEWRVDLVRLNQNATNVAGFEILDGPQTYLFFKQRDAIRFSKWSGGTVMVLSYERVDIKNTNLVLCFALTRAQTNMILTGRVLDKDNQNAVLYERSVVDTPNADPTIAASDFERLSGMRLQIGPDVVGAPLMSGSVMGLGLFQYTDGHRPAAEAIFDNFELRTYVVPKTRYVNVNGINPTPPYTNWLPPRRTSRTPWMRRWRATRSW